MSDWRLARSAGAGEGYLELEWLAATCHAGFGNFRAVVAGEPLDLKLLVATLPHSNDRQRVALRPQRFECLGRGPLTSLEFLDRREDLDSHGGREDREDSHGLRPVQPGVRVFVFNKN